MPDLRRDPITGRWVIIAAEQALRPSQFVRQPVRFKGGACSFCPGKEANTPPEIMAHRPTGERDMPGWNLRVVPNKFPVLMVEGELDRQAEGIYDRMNGIGAHEVIIESPEHEQTWATLPEKSIESALHAFRERSLDLRKDIRFKYVLLFKNHGELAGASQEHVHSQLIALPIVPRQVVNELKGAREYYQIKERCIYCDIVR